MGGQVRRYETAEARLSVESWVATIAVRGIVTDRVMLAMMTDCNNGMRSVKADALVSRLDQSVVALDANALLDSAERIIKPGEAIAVPAAIVVSPDTIYLFRAYAWQMAQRGVVRAVFTSPSEALEWARAEALVWAADRASRRLSA